MSAVVGTRYGNDRTRLEEVIPLSTPFLLFVDPSSICNFRCSFCPCGGAHKENWGSNKKTSVLSYEMFRKIVDDACEFPDQIKTLRLYKEGEPLVNKRLPDMISYARKKNVAKKIDFTTNGSLFDHDTALAITDAGVDRINISVEALSEEEYYRVSGVKLDFKKYVDNLKFLYEHKNGCHIFVKISDYGLGSHSEKEFYDMFGAVSDEMAIEHVSSVWPEFELDAGQRKNDDFDIYGAKMSERRSVQVCPYLFYSLCVNSDGSVSSCLMDWNHKLMVGDTKGQRLVDIWNGERMQEMRKNHLLLQKCVYPTCDACGQLNYAVLDNIDDYRLELFRKCGFEQ